MIILGDPRFSDELLYEVSRQDEIKETPNNATVVFRYNDTLIPTFHYCQKSRIPYAVYVNSIKEFVYAANLNSKYVFVDFSIAKEMQNIAEEYLFDTKVIVIVKKESEIEKVARLGIDGIYFLV